MMRFALGLLAVGLFAVGLFAVACSREPEPIVDGWWLVADPAALGAELDRLQGFTETPAAAWASAARSRLADCPRMVAIAPEPGELIAALRCVGEERLDLPIAEAEIDEVAWAIGGSLVGAHVLARARLEGELTVIDIELQGEPDSAGLAALLPRAATLGAPRFGGPLLIHGRFGADGGLDPASWVAEDSAGDQLFALRSRLFTSALLTGVWEVAVPAVVEGESMLPVVLAIETRGRRVARAALDAFVTDLGRSWGLQPTASRLTGLDGLSIDGACFEELGLLPALRPCWALVDDAVVVGWNAGALERSLLVDRNDENGDRPSRLVVHLDRFAEADAVLARAVQAPAEALPGKYPWQRWTIEGRRVGDDYRITVILEPSGELDFD